MPLSSTLDVARSSLAVLSDQAAVVSRNVAQAGVAGATRKVVRLTTDPGYAPRMAGIDRGVPEALQGRMLAASSDAAREDVIVAGLESLQAVADPQSGVTVGVRIGELASALQTFAARPSDLAVAGSAIASARDVVDALRSGAAAVARVREQAQSDIVGIVDDLNVQLSRLDELDTTVTSGTRSGKDVTDDLDERDRVIGRIAEQIGLTVIRRADNGVSLYTDSGITLYDGTVRQVVLTNEPLLPGHKGAALVVDGILASGPDAIMRTTSGRLAGLIELRDGIAMTWGAQLDELARGLIGAFAEADQRQPPTLPIAAGLFRAPGSNVLPPDGVVSVGLAASIEINPTVDPSRSGDVSKLRDGGIAGAPYVYNTHALSSYASRLQELVDRLSVEVDSAPGSELPPKASVSEMAAASVGWLQNVRVSSDSQSKYARSVMERASSALENVAGVSIDEQITELLELQRSYQASTKLISTVDSMFSSLLQAIG
jgi:flagellar hook-associated protein 1 FlgK